MNLRKTFGWLAALAINATCWWGLFALVVDGKPIKVTKRNPPPADTTAPTIQEWEIQEDGVTHILTFDEVVTGHTGFTYSMSGMGTGTLTYVSGEGSPSLTFTSSDATAALETGTGAATSSDVEDIAENALANFAAFAITNSADPPSDAPWNDPDLPATTPDATPPAHWDDAADHSPANNAALQELVDGDGSGDVAAGEIINLDADVDYGRITIHGNIKGTAGNEIIIRTDEFADLPAYGTRVTTADEIHMTQMSRVPGADGSALFVIEAGASGVGAQYIRLVGIKYSLTGTLAQDTYSMVAVGLLSGVSGAYANLPTNIIFDRCAFTESTTTDAQNALRFDCSNSAVVYCNFYGLYGAGNDGSTGIRIYQGGPSLIDDNYIQTRSAGLFLGDNFDSTVEDVTFSRNHKTSDLAWTGTQKAGFETKTGDRVLIEDSIFENNTTTSFQAITIKSDGSGGPKTTKNVTLRYCLFRNCARCVLFSENGSLPGDTVGPNSDMLVEHCLMHSMSATGSTMRMIELYGVANGSPGTLERIKIRHNTLVTLGSYTSNLYFSTGNPAGSNPCVNLLVDDNLIEGGVLQNINSATGAKAFNESWPSAYLIRNNAWIGQNISNFDNDTTPTPTGTLTDSLFPANAAAVQFEDYAADDYRLAAGSSLNNAASDGTDVGCDVAELNTRLIGVEGP
jgi:hypothetical protein